MNRLPCEFPAMRIYYSQLVSRFAHSATRYTVYTIKAIQLVYSFILYLLKLFVTRLAFTYCVYPAVFIARYYNFATCFDTL